VFEPLQRTTILGPFTPGAAVIGGIGLALAFVVIYVLKDPFGLVLGLALVVAALWAALLPVGGRTLDEWAPVLVRTILQRGEYRSTAPTGGMVAGSRENRIAPAESSLPTQLNGLELLALEYGNDQIGVVHDRQRGFLTGVIAARAGQFGLRDASEQDRKLAAYGGILASEAREETPVRRLQWIERTKTAQGDELAAYFQNQRDRAIPIEESRVQSYIELVDGAAPATQEHEVLVAVQIDTRKGWREMRRLGGGFEAATGVLLHEMGELSKRLEQAEITALGALRPRQLARFVRDCFDPYGSGARARIGAIDPDREGTDPQIAGPTAADTNWSHYRSDSAFHRTYWIAEWPRTGVAASFLSPLLMQTNMLRTISVVIEPRPPLLALREAESAQTAELSEETARRRRGFVTTARHRQQQDAIARREQELADGHAEVRFAGFVTISARTVVELDRKSSELEFEAQRARLVLQPMYGEQDVGFTFSLPLCRGLR
jgi:hypothetical protein